MAESHTLDIHVGLQLRRIRNRKKFSLERVGEWLNVSKQQISRFEQGKNRLSILQLYQLSRGMGIPIVWFFEGYDDNQTDVAWVSTMVREDRGDWSPASKNDKGELLLSLWRLLPNERQREQVIHLLETFAVN